MQESSGSILSAHTAQDVDTGGSLATGRFAACAAAQLRCDSSPLLDARLLQAVRSSQPRPSAKQPLPWGGSTRGSVPVLKTPLDGARGLGKLGSLATRRLTLWLTKLQRQPRHRPQGPCALAALHPVVLWVPLRTYALARGTASSHLP